VSSCRGSRPPHRLGAAALAGAIRQTATDDAMRANAARLAAAIATEGGPAEAAATIGDLATGCVGPGQGSPGGDQATAVPSSAPIP
jgi:hypothetical protein